VAKSAVVDCLIASDALISSLVIAIQRWYGLKWSVLT